MLNQEHIINNINNHQFFSFDLDSYYRLPKEVHNELRVSLYEQKVTEYYRYMGKDGILRIMMKFLVYNYSPIPLLVCGKIVNLNEYVGISQKLNIQGIAYKDSLLKVIKNEKQKQYYIFAESYIVDYYGFQFEFERQNKKILKMYSHKFKQNDLNYTVYLLPEAQFKLKIKPQIFILNLRNIKYLSSKDTNKYQYEVLAYQHKFSLNLISYNYNILVKFLFLPNSLSKQEC